MVASYSAYVHVRHLVTSLFDNEGKKQCDRGATCEMENLQHCTLLDLPVSASDVAIEAAS